MYVDEPNLLKVIKFNAYAYTIHVSLNTHNFIHFSSIVGPYLVRLPSPSTHYSHSTFTKSRHFTLHPNSTRSRLGGRCSHRSCSRPTAAGTAAAAMSSGQAGRRIQEMMRRSSRTTSGSSTRLGRGRARPTGSLLTRRWGLRWWRRHFYVYAGDSEDGDEASTGHTRRTGRNVGATDSGGRRRRGT
jgi:hypothetical protein